MRQPPTLRRSVAGGIWSIVAPQRSGRPKQLAEADTESQRNCHFCEGNEGETEPEIFALRHNGSPPDSPGWRVRVVPNKYPALHANAQEASGAFRPHRLMPAQGFHEVIIETPDHVRGFGGFDVQELAAVLGVYRSRLRALSARPEVKSVALFRNEGTAAGASQEHPHAQVLGLPIVSSRLAREVTLARQHLRRRGCCITCEMLERECLDGGRIVLENADFAVITAFAPRFPYESWIIPKSHAHDFGMTTPQLRTLAGVLIDLLRGLNTVLGSFPYNLVLQTAPTRGRKGVDRAYHCRVEIIPRVTTASGFELGSGIFVVAVSPEEAARKLRTALSGDVTPR